jgi:hypothetical protein
MMQTAQLRDMVIDKIYGINDSDYLKALKKILDMRKTSEEVYHLNEEQKAVIRLGKQQISNGEYISNEDLEKEEDQWLNE